MGVQEGFLLASDFHETPRPRDAYRWEIFDFLELQIRRIGAAGWLHPTVVISGDFVDAKDKHPAVLVNLLVERLLRLAAMANVLLLKGNHDYIDEDQPFFGFVDDLPGIAYVTRAEFVVIGGLNVLCIPHSRNWNTNTEWRKRCPFIPPEDRCTLDGERRYDYLLCHQTFKGAQASNGDRMEGVPLSTVSAEMTNGAPVLSGDIHVPQTVGNVTYVGSPHPVCFGDNFEPRILLVERDSVTSIPNPTVLARHKFKLSADDVEGDWTLDIFEGDQVKVDLSVSRADVLDAAALRERVKSRIAEAGGHHYGTDVTVVDSKVNRRRRFADLGQDTTTSSLQTVWSRYCQHRNVPVALAEAGGRYL